MKERTRRPPARSAPPRSGPPRSGPVRSGPARSGPPRSGPAGAPRRAPGGYAPPRGRPRGAPAAPSRDDTGTRTGPRARAAQKRSFDDPYQRAQRPPRDEDRGAPRDRLSAPGVIRLDADVARVFRDAESVNEALRMVMRLARFGGGRPPGPPREYTPRDAPPRGAGPRGERPARPTRPPRDGRGADDLGNEEPDSDGPRFDED